jgi:hypothetical protein
MRCFDHTAPLRRSALSEAYEYQIHAQIVYVLALSYTRQMQWRVVGRRVNARPRGSAVWIEINNLSQ